MSAPSLTRILQSENPPNVTLSKAAELSQIFLKKCRSIVEKICEQIEDSFPASAGKIKCFVKGGALGNDTAVYGREDVDSVIVVCFDYDDVTDIKELVKSHKSKSRKIMETIESRLVNMAPTGIEVDDVGDNGISCTVTIPSGPLDLSVYVMATFYADVSQAKVREAIYAEMDGRPGDEKEILNASLSQLQVDFVGKANQQVKSLIRLVKFWAQKGFQEKEGQQLPSPYLLELITISCWEHANSPETFKFANALHAVLSTLKDYRSLKAVWTKNYSYSKLQEYAKIERPPSVMDPANPTTNVARECNAWDEVLRGADQSLKSPLLRNLTSPKSVWS